MTTETNSTGSSRACAKQRSNGNSPSGEQALGEPAVVNNEDEDPDVDRFDTGASRSLWSPTIRTLRSGAFLTMP